jgi:hypothetical protein
VISGCTFCNLGWGLIGSQSTKAEQFINLKTAKAFEPDRIAIAARARADEIIE